MKISNEIFSDYQNCRYKAFLRTINEEIQNKEYDVFYSNLLNKKKEIYLKNIQSSSTHIFKSNDILSKEDLEIGYDYLQNVTVTTNNYGCKIDLLKGINNKMNNVKTYIPIVFIPFKRISLHHKRILAFQYFCISELTSNVSNYGEIIDSSLQSHKINLSELLKSVENDVDEINDIVVNQKEPKLRLNKHCSLCCYEFHCKQKAISIDSLSLLGGINNKEIDKYNNQGIFTLHQLSFTFRPRRRIKKVKKVEKRHFFSLHALSIREKTIYIYERPNLPNNSIKIYIDIEGDPDRNFYYLIGVVIENGGSLEKHSFWLENSENIKPIGQFLDLISKHEDFTVYFYGNYEKRFLSFIKDKIGKSKIKIVKQIELNSINVLELIYPSVYFPVYNYDLKSISTYLGFDWKYLELKGTNSILARLNWENNGNNEIKQKLLSYNLEDCFALKKLVDFLFLLQQKKEVLELVYANTSISDNFNKELTQKYGGHKFGAKINALKEFEFINKCAYFDYQRNKIYVRTNKYLKRVCKQRVSVIHNKPNTEINILPSRKCPICKSENIEKIGKKRHSKIVVDLLFSSNGIKRWILKYNSVYQKCSSCGICFFPDKYAKIRGKYGHNIQCWYVYQNIINSVSGRKIALEMHECFSILFGENVTNPDFFKKNICDYYERAYKRIFSNISEWNIIHVDETSISIRGEKAYVWIFTNMLDVIYVFREDRTTDFLYPLISQFKGVLISDFYKGYDGVKCLQQKCHIHLLRDLNEELYKNPFNEELKLIANIYTSLMKPIIDTIDKYGLKQRNLNKYNKEVNNFYSIIENSIFKTDVAKVFSKRFITYKNSLFTFLNYDNIPWNNNNAEHSIKEIAIFRKQNNGLLTQKSVKSSLIILSLYQTCKCRNISFLNFLLSKERTIDSYVNKYTPLGNRRTKT